MDHLSFESPLFLEIQATATRERRGLRRNARPSIEQTFNGPQSVLEARVGGDRQGILRDTKPRMKHHRARQSSRFFDSMAARERQAMLQEQQTNPTPILATTFGETSEQTVANDSLAQVKMRLEESEKTVNFLEQQMTLLQIENERLKSEIASLQQKSPKRKALPPKKSEKVRTFQTLQRNFNHVGLRRMLRKSTR
jgi:chaperonin cofactor prefoldin